MQIKLAVFDIAGTTVVDRGNINIAFREAFLTAGIHVSSEEVDTVMGYRKIEAIRMVIQKHAPDLNEDSRIISDIHDVFEDSMVSFYENDDLLIPMPQAEYIFQELQRRNIKVALNTGFTRRITDTILEKLGWIDSLLIDATICSDEVLEGRPYPYMIQHLMQELLIDSVEDVIKIGDTEVDIKEGRNAGCGIVIAVTTGAYSHEKLKLYHPDFIIDSLNELLPIIAEINK